MAFNLSTELKWFVHWITSDAAAGEGDKGGEKDGR